MNIQVSEIIFQLFNFGVVLGALSYLLYKPVIKVFDERSRRIEEGQRAASSAIEQQEQIEILKDKAEQKARKQAAAILAQAQEEAQQERKTIIAQAKSDAQAEIEAQKQSLDKQYQQRVQELDQQLVDTVIATTQKVLGETIDAKKHAQLVDTELQSLRKLVS